MIQNSTITFESATQITTNPLFFIPVGLIWFVTFVLLFIIGVSAKARVGNRVSKTLMISSYNFWYVVLLHLFLGILFMFIIFPVWLIVITG